MLRVHASKFVRTVSLLPVLIVLGVVGLEYYQFVIVRIVNGTLSRDGGPAVIVAEMIVFHVFIALVLASFARVVLTDPGYVTPEVIATLQDEVQSAMEAQGVDLVELHDLASMSFCRRCRQAKPMRAHHCSVCDRCVLKMDHHCPWVGNCIGARNYKYFLLFVSYAFLATSIIVITLFGQFQRSFIETPHAGDDVLPFAGIIAVVVAIALALSLLIFICVHGSLLRFGSSTIECHIFGTKSPYNRGLQANCRAVFGDGPMWRWLLPVPQNFAHGSQGAAYLLELQRFRAEQLVGDDEAERFL